MDRLQPPPQRSETELAEPINPLQREINSTRINLHRLNRSVAINYGLNKRRENLSNGSPTTDESTEVEDEDPEDDEDAIATAAAASASGNFPRKAATAVCGLCHLPPSGTASSIPGIPGIPGIPNAETGQMFSCAHGHLLCQRCVQRFAVCSEIGCAVCGGDICASTPSCCRIRSCGSSDRRNFESACEDPRSGTAAVSCGSAMRSMALEGPRSWSRGCNEAVADNGAVFFGANSRRCNNAAITEFNCSGLQEGNADGDTSGRRSASIWPNTNSIRMQQQQQNNRLRNNYVVARGGDADTIDSDNPMMLHQKNGNAALVQAECSRRPIRCPRLDCAVNVAFSALTHHFLFDHPEVPILSVEPGAKSTLVVSFAALSCDSSRCLALLLVSGKLTGIAARLFNGSQIQPRYRNRLPLPVLAARLHCAGQNVREENQARGEGQGQGDVVIAWVAGLDVGVGTSKKLRCSIQATDGDDNEGFRSLTYTGPVNSLRTAQRPREVFRTGDCVILHQGFIDHISTACTSLNVNVIVH